MSTVSDYANPATVTAAMAPPDPKLKVQPTQTTVAPKNNIGQDVKDFIKAKGLQPTLDTVKNVGTQAISALNQQYGLIKGPIGQSLGKIPGFDLASLGGGLLGEGFSDIFGPTKYEFNANQEAIKQIGGDLMGIANELNNANGKVLEK